MRGIEPIAGALGRYFGLKSGKYWLISPNTKIFSLLNLLIYGNKSNHRPTSVVTRGSRKGEHKGSYDRGLRF